LSEAPERHRERACAKHNEQFAAIIHLITLSARNRLDLGILTPSAFAVL
jgi:hypothetical protein